MNSNQTVMKNPYKMRISLTNLGKTSINMFVANPE